MRAHNINSCHYSFTHPDDGIVKVCNQIKEDYLSMLNSLS
jgi:hypothetical protein